MEEKKKSEDQAGFEPMTTGPPAQPLSALPTQLAPRMPFFATFRTPYHYNTNPLSTTIA